MGNAGRRWRRVGGAAGATVVAGMLVGGLVGASQAGASRAAATSPAGGSAALAATVTPGGAKAGAVGGGTKGGTGRGAGASRGVAGGDAGSGRLRCTQARFSAAQQQIEHDLAARAQRLSTLTTLVHKAAAKGLSSSDAAALSAILTAEQSTIDGGGIAGLQKAVAAETTCTQLAASARQMVVDFRVFALVTPQVRLTVGHDVASALVARGTAAEPRISARIAAAARHGRDVAGAERAFTDFQVRISAAGQVLSGTSTSQLLAQTPADYPGDKALLQAGRTTGAKVRADLKAARGDLRTIRQDLTGYSGPGAGTSAGGSAGTSSGGSAGTVGA